MRLNLVDFCNLLEESKHSFSVISLTGTQLKKHEFKTNSNYHHPNYERIQYERKTNKRRVRFLCILGMILPIKFETICIFLMTIEKFS